MVPPTSHKGRFHNQVPVSNLKELGDDFQEFEPFDGSDDATPRTYPGGGTLEVNRVDMCQQMNKPNHYTDAYFTQNLVVRRGQEFLIRITFSRELNDMDDFQLEFLIGSNPSPNKDSLVVVTFGGHRRSHWAGRVVEKQRNTVMFGVTPTAKAIVGKYRTYVAISAGSGMVRTRRNPDNDLYLLFNAWCPEDPVFLPNESERMEYVMNDNGVICQGSIGAMVHRDWVYGQFEQGILEACIFILDSSRMPIYNRGNVIKVVRKGSAMINSQDDNGVLVGNWSDDYSMGTAPTAWVGSVRILQQYANTGVPVCYGQCWVYAGVFCTFLRCLGIPTRVITNFSSAHDNTGNLKTDLIFKPDGTPDRRATRDSIWNYHCWNEVFMVRPDLPEGYGGWQVVDSTPQETSDGHYRCGPASVRAIKEGRLCHPFDHGFVFAEVNSDVVFLKKDKYGTMKPFRVDKTHVGQGLFTKAPGTNQQMNITLNYKYPEGSAEDSQTMARAEEYGCEREHSDVPEEVLVADISSEQCQLGDDMELLVTLENRGDANRTVSCNLDGCVVYYTGVEASVFKNMDFTVAVAGKQKNSVTLKISADEYLPHLGTQMNFQFTLSGRSEDQWVSVVKVITLLSPPLNLTVSEQLVTVFFTNPLKEPLHHVFMFMEGAGVLPLRRHYIQKVEAKASISWAEPLLARRPGHRRVVAVLYCSKLPQVFGHLDVFISPPPLTYA